MYLAVLGRQSEISIAELEALFDDVRKKNEFLANFESKVMPDIDRLGGSLKLAQKLDTIAYNIDAYDGTSIGQKEIPR